MMFIFKEKSESSAFNKDLIQQKKEVLKVLKRNKGPVLRFCHWFFVKIFGRLTPILEIFHNWLIINTSALRTVKYLEENCPEAKEKIKTMATILAYLEMARFERDFANAWSYVNLAMTLLPLVANESEFKACQFLMSVSDRKAQFPDQKTRKAILDAINLDLELSRNTKDYQKINNHLDHITKMLDYLSGASQSPGVEIAENLPSQAKQCSKDDDQRYQRYEQRLNESQMWNSRNRQVSMLLSLWRSLGYGFLPC